jgi:hypothetical protein
MPGPSGLFPLIIDEGVWDADLKRSTNAARYQALAWRRRLEILGGIPREVLLPCRAEDDGGLSLPNCVKTRIPRADISSLSASPWGAVLVFAKQADKPAFAFLAFGLRHPEAVSSTKPSVYAIAHDRLFPAN